MSKNAGRATSKHRTAATAKELESKQWTKCTTNQLAVITEKDIMPDSQGKRGFGVELPVSKAVKPVVVTVAFKNWDGEEGVSLARVVKETMIMVGMEPKFRASPAGPEEQ